MWFKILWAVDAVAAFGAIYFFVAGIVDGIFSSQNILLWILILAILFIVMYGSFWLKKRKKPFLGILLLLTLAVPVLLYLLFISIALFGKQQWN